MRGRQPYALRACTTPSENEADRMPPPDSANAVTSSTGGCGPSPSHLRSFNRRGSGCSCALGCSAAPLAAGVAVSGLSGGAALVSADFVLSASDDLLPSSAQLNFCRRAAIASTSALTISLNFAARLFAVLSAPELASFEGAPSIAHSPQLPQGDPNSNPRLFAMFRSRWASLCASTARRRSSARVERNCSRRCEAVSIASVVGSGPSNDDAEETCAIRIILRTT